MRQRIVLALLLIAWLIPAYASRPDIYFTAHGDIRDRNITNNFARSHVVGFGLEFRHKRNRGGEPYYGFTISQIRSDIQISEYGDPYTMYPVYGYVGYALNLPLTPFVEYGVDMVDVMFSDTSDGSGEFVDTYVAIGGMVQLKRIGFVKGYWKRTYIRPYLAAPVELFMVGGSVGFHFD